MHSRWAVIVGFVVLVTISVQFAFAGEEKKMKADPKVVMKTSEGAITIELWANKTPQSVENFLLYVGEKFYDGTIFHRVIDGFMIQGGGLTVDMQRKPTHKPVQNEASAELTNDRGTISMARTQDIHSATSQFFINVKDNDFLNHRDNTPQGFGYAVFGKVVDGMDVVDRIKGVKTTTSGPHRDVPEKPVIIENIRLLEQD